MCEGILGSWRPSDPSLFGVGGGHAVILVPGKVPGEGGDVIVRHAGEADRESVLALYRELRPNDPLLSDRRAAELWLSVCDSPRSTIVVCEDEGTIAATCMLALVANLASEGRPIGLVEHVITGQDFRRRGLAEACLRFALDHAWRLGCCKVVLLSGAQRPQAHRLYEKVGFDGDVERGFVVKRPADA